MWVGEGEVDSAPLLQTNFMKLAGLGHICSSLLSQYILYDKEHAGMCYTDPETFRK